MMGPCQRIESKLFYMGIRLDERIPAGHILRRIAAAIDFGFVRAEVAHCYGVKGNISVDPVVLLKLMLILHLENVFSERRLMDHLPCRLDWMWFCGYDFDDTLPQHSVLSKARERWGPEVFARLFAEVLARCLEAGLVAGDTVHVDSSLIAADASKDTLRPALRAVGAELYRRLDESSAEEMEVSAAEQAAADPPAQPAEAPIRRGALMSETDPDARLTRKYGQSVLGYKDHRVVDDRNGVITATITTHAAEADGAVLEELLDQHAENTDSPAQMVVADKAYGTGENYRMLQERQVQPCIPHKQPSACKGKYHHEEFKYDPVQDCYHCPAGEMLTRRRTAHCGTRHRYWAAKGVCARCRLRAKCTDSTRGRIVDRNVNQEYVEWADNCLPKGRRRELMGRRKTKAEGSFAESSNTHGFKRARWRGLIKMTIQNLLIAAVQNLRKLANTACPKPAAANHKHGSAASAARLAHPLTGQ